MKNIVRLICVLILCLPVLLSGQDGPARYMRSRLGKYKKANLVKYGGTPATEEAVALALEWFQAQQEKDGRWSPEQIHVRCNDNKPQVADQEWQVDGISIDVPATALVLSCFSGGGPDTLKKYPAVYIKGLKWLKEQQQRDGSFGAKNYTNAIAAMALLEAYALTGDRDTKERALKALHHLEKVQSSEGGWDYHGASQRNDLSVTGWVVQALAAGEDMQLLRYKKIRAKRPAPRFADGALNKSYTFLEKVLPPLKDNDTDGDARYAYHTNNPEDQSHSNGNLNAVGSYCLLKTGNITGDKRLFALANRVTMHLLPHPKTKRWYGWYYGTQVCFQLGGEYWEQWNRHMQAVFLGRQKKDGIIRGSWDPYGEHATHYTGRLFPTAVAVMSLQVYYRFPRALDLNEIIPRDFPRPKVTEVRNEEQVVEWDEEEQEKPAPRPEDKDKEEDQAGKDARKDGRKKEEKPQPAPPPEEHGVDDIKEGDSF